MRFILLIIATALAPILMVGLFTNPVTAYITIISLVIIYSYIESKKRPDQWIDSKISSVRINQALENYIKVVVNKDVEN